MTLDRLLQYLRYSSYLRGSPLLEILVTVFFPNFVKFVSFANRIYYSFSYPRVVNGGTYSVSGFRYFAGLVNMALYNS